MTEAVQTTIFDFIQDQDTSFGKMSWEHSPHQEKPTKEKTSRQSSQKSSGSSAPMPLMCLCLRREHGASQDASMEWETMESPFPWHGKSMTLNTGESLRDAADYACYATSQGLQRQRNCLTLNTSEHPRMDIQTRLSDILEQETDPKYDLSAKACEGILRRAERRGKKLPEQLRIALEEQSHSKREPENQGFGDYKESDTASALKQRDYKDATDLVVEGTFQNTGQGWWNESEIGATLRTPCSN